MTKRYYMQCTTIPLVFKSNHQTGWLIFDREQLSMQGTEEQVIAWAIYRRDAQKIRDALNGDINAV